MNEIIKNIEAAQLKNNIPDFNVGDTVRVYAKVVEGEKERLQMFEGVVIKRQNGGIRETFTVRRIASGVGVEKTFPIHSPLVEKIEVVRRGDVRRAKLHYMRERTGKSAKIKAKEYSEEQLAAIAEAKAAADAEAAAKAAEAETVAEAEVPAEADAPAAEEKTEE